MLFENLFLNYFFIFFKGIKQRSFQQERSLKSLCFNSTGLFFAAAFALHRESIASLRSEPDNSTPSSCKGSVIPPVPMLTSRRESIFLSPMNCFHSLRMIYDRFSLSVRSYISALSYSLFIVCNLRHIFYNMYKLSMRLKSFSCTSMIFIPMKVKEGFFL